jgi:hypothetical protein
MPCYSSLTDDFPSFFPFHEKERKEEKGKEREEKEAVRESGHPSRHLVSSSIIFIR